VSGERASASHARARTRGRRCARRHAEQPRTTRTHAWRSAACACTACEESSGRPEECRREHALQGRGLMRRRAGPSARRTPRTFQGPAQTQQTAPQRDVVAATTQQRRQRSSGALPDSRCGTALPPPQHHGGAAGSPRSQRGCRRHVGQRRARRQARPPSQTRRAAREVARAVQAASALAPPCWRRTTTAPRRPRLTPARSEAPPWA
jgi:hypothetical protein